MLNLLTSAFTSSSYANITTRSAPVGSGTVSISLRLKALSLCLQLFLRSLTLKALVRQSWFIITTIVDLLSLQRLYHMHVVQSFLLARSVFLILLRNCLHFVNSKI